MVARTVPLRCWRCARRPADRLLRFRPKACAIVAVNSWRPVFFSVGQTYCVVLRMIRARMKRMTRASILHAACLKIINMWSCVLSAWSASRLFRSFSMQYVRALAYVRVERFHSALPTHTDVSFSNHILQTITMADSIIQNGEVYGGLGTCRSSYLSPCWCERYV